MDLYMRKEKKVYAIFTAEAIVLLASTFIVILGSLQLLDVNMKALAQSSTSRILKVDNQSRTISVLVDRNLNGPITDIEFYNGKLYVSHRGIISTVELQTGLVKDIIVGLPSIGDHHNNQIAIGGGPNNNRIYFGQGEATNSGVVGEDNFRLGWAKTAPYFHDIPAKNITLTGQNFITKNPLTAEPNDNATTGAF